MHEKRPRQYADDVWNNGLRDSLRELLKPVPQHYRSTVVDMVRFGHMAKAQAILEESYAKQTQRQLEAQQEMENCNDT